MTSMVSILPGLPVSLSDFRTFTLFLDDNTPVPAGAQYLGGCAFAQTGEAYVCPRPAGGTANQTISFLGGKAVRGDGAQIILVGGVQNQKINGCNYTSLGELIPDTNTPVRFPQAIGTSETGVASLSDIV